MRNLLIQGDKTFKITIQDDDQVTFGPWSPPGTKESTTYGTQEGKRGTLRIYRGSKQNIIACFSGVRTFRDLSMGYAEEVAREEGAVLWKSDENGYQREEKVSRARDWVDGTVKALPVAKEPATKSRKR